jgi:hypothetical protein
VIKEKKTRTAAAATKTNTQQSKKRTQRRGEQNLNEKSLNEILFYNSTRREMRNGNIFFRSSH